MEPAVAVTVAVYVPGDVPVLEVFVFVDDEPPPHPIDIAIVSVSGASKAANRLRLPDLHQHSPPNNASISSGSIDPGGNRNVVPGIAALLLVVANVTVTV
jgi:hypothetical protein